MSPRDELFAVRRFSPSKKVESGLCARLCADAWRLLSLSLSSSWSSSSNARAVYLIGCDSSQLMSLSISLHVGAGGLIALLCIPYMVTRLLLICDVVIGGGCKSSWLCVRRSRVFCHVVQSFPDDRTARWSVTSAMSGLVGRGGKVVLPASAACVQTSSCRAEFS